MVEVEVEIWAGASGRARWRKEEPIFAVLAVVVTVFERSGRDVQRWWWVGLGIVVAAAVAKSCNSTRENQAQACQGLTRGAAAGHADID